MGTVEPSDLCLPPAPFSPRPPSLSCEFVPPTINIQKFTYGRYLCFGNPFVHCQDSAQQRQLRGRWLLQTLPSRERSGSTTPETSEMRRIEFACRRKEEPWRRTERANAQKPPEPADWLTKQIRIVQFGLLSSAFGYGTGGAPRSAAKRLELLLAFGAFNSFLEVGPRRVRLESPRRHNPKRE